MNSSSIVSLIIILVCILLSMYFSSTETAFNAASRIRLKSKAEDGSKRAALVLKLLDRYDAMLTTILIGWLPCSSCSS